ncbi:MAG: hypothetical protein ISR65_09060 [Bacteriovoracaceae bacterium]|nr:hypothetical protein [Bacteriovoracaceae bacterium]
MKNLIVILTLTLVFCQVALSEVKPFGTRLSHSGKSFGRNEFVEFELSHQVLYGVAADMKGEKGVRVSLIVNGKRVGRPVAMSNARRVYRWDNLNITNVKKVRIQFDNDPIVYRVRLLLDEEVIVRETIRTVEVPVFIEVPKSQIGEQIFKIHEILNSIKLQIDGEVYGVDITDLIRISTFLAFDLISQTLEFKSADASIHVVANAVNFVNTIDCMKSKNMLFDNLVYNGRKQLQDQVMRLSVEVNKFRKLLTYFGRRNCGF